MVNNFINRIGIEPIEGDPQFKYIGVDSDHVEVDADGKTLTKKIEELESKQTEITADAIEAALGYVPADVEDVPVVYDWAKEAEKPSYTADEVGALPDTAFIPTSISDLTTDEDHMTVSEVEKQTWNAKSEFSGNYNDLIDIPEDLVHNADIENKADKATTLEGYGITDAVAASQIGSANGVAGLNESGKVPAAQLPSYVDDVEEYISKVVFPEQGESGKIYIDTTTNITYRWGGTEYVPIGSDLALGETSSTAYAGDKGKANADAIKELKDSEVRLTQAEYDALGDEKLTNGVKYYITDAEGGGSGSSTVPSMTYEYYKEHITEYRDKIVYVTNMDGGSISGYVGTQVNVEIALANGDIPLGALVFVTDDYDDLDDSVQNSIDRLDSDVLSLQNQYTELNSKINDCFVIPTRLYEELEGISSYTASKNCIVVCKGQTINTPNVVSTLTITNSSTGYVEQTRFTNPTNDSAFGISCSMIVKAGQTVNINVANAFLQNVKVFV